MKSIPLDERYISDEELFAAFDLNRPELHPVRSYLKQNNLSMAKAALIQHFQTRTQPTYFFDYRSLPLSKIDMEILPSFFFTSAGAGRSLKEFCLHAGKKLQKHVYVRHGNEGIEIDFGSDYEYIPHFNYYEDQGKKHRTILDIFVRGHIFEYLSVLYHETGDQKVLVQFEETLQMFFKHYPLVIECTDADASHFSFTEERDVMSAGYLALLYLSLFYTRISYEINTELAFELLKRVWFLGIQFRRFDADTYKKHNHHMWERGLVPYMLGTLLPEIPDFVAVKEHAANIIRQHIRDDFNQHGGYSEHSIAYWSGAALGGMLCRGIYLAQLNGENLLDEDTRHRIELSYDALALICPPGSTYPAIGDNGGSSVVSVLHTGAKICGNASCKEVLELRHGTDTPSASDLPLDFCDDLCGFVCSRSSYRSNANYILMSAKIDCGNSGHNHMDMLSLSLSFGGHDFVGEPHSRQLYHTIRMGSDQRGYMYNMEAHNTVLAYGQPISPNRMYAHKWGVYRPDSPVSEFVTCEHGIRASAYHDAYAFCRHQRSILFHRERGILVQDSIFGGSRLPDAHIQRWNLMPDVTYHQVDDRSVLLTKSGVTILALWSGKPSLSFWKKEDLVPENVKHSEDLSTVMDASFFPGQEGHTVRDVAIQHVLFLDVTNRIPSTDQYERLLQDMNAIMIPTHIQDALDMFPAL